MRGSTRLTTIYGSTTMGSRLSIRYEMLNAIVQSAVPPKL